MKKFLICLLLCGASVYGAENQESLDKERERSKEFWSNFGELGDNSFVRAQCQKEYERDGEDKSGCLPCKELQQIFVDMRSGVLLEETDPRIDFRFRPTEVRYHVHRIGLNARRSDSEIKTEQEKVVDLYKGCRSDWAKVLGLYKFLDPCWGKKGSISESAKRRWGVLGLSDEGLSLANSFSNTFFWLQEKCQENEAIMHPPLLYPYSRLGMDPGYLLEYTKMIRPEIRDKKAKEIYDEVMKKFTD